MLSNISSPKTKNAIATATSLYPDDPTSTCDWAVEQCHVIDRAPQKCQRGGCSKYLHHICSIEWEMKNKLPEGNIASLCRAHHQHHKKFIAAAAATASTASNSITGGVNQTSVIAATGTIAAAESTITLPSGPVTLTHALCDRRLLVDDARWFKMLQDVGEEMTPAEEITYGNGVGGKGKKKTRKITYGGIDEPSRFYGDLYSLSTELFEKLDKLRETHFPHLPKQTSKSTAVHAIGQWIAKRRIAYCRADVHNIGSDGDGFMRFIDSPNYSESEQYYILTQSTTMEFLFSRYGVKGEEKRMTIDDKVRVAGIIFRDDLRFYLEDMIGTSRASKSRAVLDEASAKKLAGMKRLHEHFIDTEVVVNLPDEWNTDENRTSVDEINGEGMFDQFGLFNPNNPARIALLWTQSDVASIFAKVLSEYNAAMEKYTKGTGGGSGSHALFGVWDEARSEQHKQWKDRPAGWLAQYAGQMSMLYLGVVLMWDAQFNYIFHAKKDPMPADCMIDSQHDEDNDDANFTFNTPNYAVAARGSGGKKSSSDINSLLTELQKGRESANDNQHKMMSFVQSGQHDTSSATGTAACVKKINDTLNVISQCNKQLANLRKKKKGKWQ
jgi:hypothetical protein